MHITVIGAGAWGTAMAMAACRHPAGHTVRLHARDPVQADTMAQQRQNSRYLPGIDLPAGLSIVNGPLAPWVDQQAGPTELWVVATPMSGLRACLQVLQHSGR